MWDRRSKCRRNWLVTVILKICNLIIISLQLDRETQTGVGGYTEGMHGVFMSELMWVVLPFPPQGL